MQESEKKILLGMTPDELRAEVKELGMPAFTAKQILQWIYQHHVSSIGEMTNISKANRERLEQVFTVGTVPPALRLQSTDGTVKYLFPVKTDRPTDRPKEIKPAEAKTTEMNPSDAKTTDASPSDAMSTDAKSTDASPSDAMSTDAKSTDASPSETTRYVETVFIPDHDRGTLCVSSQVGCKMNCLFCETGKQGWQGNLTVADILNQIYALPEHDRLTNIVFMGQGEPMDNLDAVLRATLILTQPDGYAWSPKRITVSSVGIKDKLKRFLDESDCHVAISMHSAIHEQRKQLMPAEKQMPISEVVSLLKQYDFTHQRRCSFEYICFAGLNDTMLHAREIVKLVQGLDCRVNLIRFHKIPEVNLPEADEKRMESFRDYLSAHGVFTTIRASRGQDIFAACGLLSTAQKANDRTAQKANDRTMQKANDCTIQKPARTTTEKTKE